MDYEGCIFIIIHTFLLQLGTTEYGRGFHEGAQWADTQSNLKDIWRLLSIHGDFVLEILYYFKDEDKHAMMDDLLLSENVDTGQFETQDKGHLFAWTAGQVIGLWNINPDSEKLYLTEKGKFFKNLVHKTNDLKERFQQLEQFWNSYISSVKLKKPNTTKGQSELDGYSPGPMNAISAFINRLTNISTDPSQLYVIRKVTPISATVSCIADGTEIIFPSNQIKDVCVDEDTGYLLINIEITK